MPSFLRSSFIAAFAGCLSVFAGPALAAEPTIDAGRMRLEQVLPQGHAAAFDYYKQVLEAHAAATGQHGAAWVTKPFGAYGPVMAQMEKKAEVVLARLQGLRTPYARRTRALGEQVLGQIQATRKLGTPALPVNVLSAGFAQLATSAEYARDRVNDAYSRSSLEDLAFYVEDGKRALDPKKASAILDAKAPKYTSETRRRYHDYLLRLLREDKMVPLPTFTKFTLPQIAAPFAAHIAPLGLEIDRDKEVAWEQSHYLMHDAFHAMPDFGTQLSVRAFLKGPARQVFAAYPKLLGSKHGESVYDLVHEKTVIDVAHVAEQRPWIKNEPAYQPIMKALGAVRTVSARGPRARIR